MSDLKHMMTAITDGDAHIVDVTRREARELVGDWLSDAHGQLEAALDKAQGEADEEGKTVYVVLAIKGAVL